MATSGFERIEADIEQLSLTEQVRLMERLARMIGERAQAVPAVQEGDLVAMATDPAIQRELRQIEAEFAASRSVPWTHADSRRRPLES